MVGRFFASSKFKASPSATAVLTLNLSGAFGSFLSSFSSPSTVVPSSLMLPAPQTSSVGPAHTSTAMPFSVNTFLAKEFLTSCALHFLSRSFLRNSNSVAESSFSGSRST